MSSTSVHLQSDLFRNRTTLPVFCGLATVLFAVALTSAGCGSSSPSAPSAVAVTITGTGISTYTYTADVAPILNADCVRCHNASQHDAGLNFTTYAGVLVAVTPGSDQSPLVRVIQPTGAMYANLTGNRNQKVQIIYDWVVNSRAAQ